MWRTRTLNIHELKEVIWSKEAIKSAHIGFLIDKLDHKFLIRDSKKLIATSRKHFGERDLV